MQSSAVVKAGNIYCPTYSRVSPCTWYIQVTAPGLLTKCTGSGPTCDLSRYIKCPVVLLVTQYDHGGVQIISLDSTSPKLGSADEVVYDLDPVLHSMEKPI